MGELSFYFTCKSYTYKPGLYFFTHFLEFTFTFLY